MILVHCQIFLADGIQKISSIILMCKILECLCTRDMYLHNWDVIRISMHSQRYDTLKIHMTQLAMQCDTIHPYYDAVQFDSTQCDSMQWKKIWLLLFIWFRLTANHKLTVIECVFWLLMSRGLFHKTSLLNRPGLFRVVWLIVKWFGSIKQI